MADWREHLTPKDAERLAELDQQAADASKERRKIFDRTRKRAARTKQAGKNIEENNS